MADDSARALTRQRLRALTKLMLGIALLAVIYVSFSTGFSGSNQADDIPTLRVDLSGIPAGESYHLLWESRPVIILHRTKEQMSALDSNRNVLLDASSQHSDQPAALQNATRSVAPEWFVALSSGMDLGCSVSYISEQIRANEHTLEGALKDSCRGSLYDLAGRVLLNQHAGKNLIVPDYKLKGSELILGAQQ